MSTCYSWQLYNSCNFPTWICPKLLKIIPCDPLYIDMSIVMVSSTFIFQNSCFDLNCILFLHHLWSPQIKWTTLLIDCFAFSFVIGSKIHHIYVLDPIIFDSLLKLFKAPNFIPILNYGFFMSTSSLNSAYLGLTCTNASSVDEHDYSSSEPA